MKLYRVSTKLFPKEGLITTITEWEAVEKNKVFIITRSGDKYDTSIKHLKKERIGLLEDGSWINGMDRIEYLAFCYEQDIELYRQKTKDIVIKTALSYQEKINTLISHIPLADLNIKNT